MKKNINVNSVKELQRTLINECNQIVGKVQGNSDIYKSVENFLKSNVEKGGIGLLRGDNTKKILINFLVNCSKVEISSLTKNIVLSTLNAVEDISNLATLKKACKTIDQLANKSLIPKPSNLAVKLPLERIVILLMQYVYQVLYLEYSSFYHYYLFPKGDPEYDDVIQGEIGDCYLLAALSSLCKSREGQKAIKKCFVNRDTIDKNNFVEIKLFSVKVSRSQRITPSLDMNGRVHGLKLGQCYERMKSEPNGSILIKFDKNERGAFAHGNALWVKFFEKAFEAYREGSNIVAADTNDMTVQTYIKNWHNRMSDALDSGTSDIVLTAITGKTSYSIQLVNKSSNNSDYYTPNELSIYNTIKKKLDKKLAVTAGKRGNSKDSNHMYSVISLGESSEQNDYLKLILFNPLGRKETIGLKAFVGNFVVLNVESSKK